MYSEHAHSLQCCFLTGFALLLHSPSSLISNYLNLPFGTQGRSWRLKPFPYKQEMGDTEEGKAFALVRALQGPASLHRKDFEAPLEHVFLILSF